MGIRDAIINLSLLYKNRRVVTEFMAFMDTLYSENELVFVITNHLFTEFIINSVIEQKQLKLNGRNAGYKLKLEKLYVENLIPEYLYNNLVGLNDLRNSYAHSLLPDMCVTSYTTCSPSNFKNIKNIKKVSEFVMEEFSCSDLDDPDVYHEFLRDMITSTVILFMTHVDQELGVEIPFERIIPLEEVT